MGNAIDAGKLDQRLEVLELRESAPGVWEWAVARRTWGQVTLQDKRCLFSTVGIGARSAQVVARRQALTLHHALGWGGRHLFLTAVIPRGRGHLDVSAALVETVACVGRPVLSAMGQGNRPDRKAGDAIHFPGVLTEKYLGYTRQETHAVNDTGLVLVSPKAVLLKAGDLVDIGGETYNVRVVHTLDPWKNEYEINMRKGV